MSAHGPVEYPEHDGIAYLSGVTTPFLRTVRRHDLGLLVTPASSIHRQLDHYELWAADNGCYIESKAGRPFDPDRWLRWLAAMPRRDALFAALPDVLEWRQDERGRSYCVGNLDATIERSARYVDAVKDLGYPAAIVAQDGLAELEELPFEVDAVFVGGSDAYKLSETAAGVVAQARARGMWAHVGRVNSYGRLSYCASIGVDSADGTYIRFGPKVNAPKVLGWLDRVNTIDALAA